MCPCFPKEFYKDDQGNKHSISYSYDGTGNRTEYKDVTSALTTTYTYNNNTLNQLETVTKNTITTQLTELDVWGVFNGYIGSNTISVDDVELDNDTEISDNIFFTTLTSFSSPVVIETLTDTINLELDNESDICYTYDNNGNLIYKSQNGQGVIYLWDALNRLSDVYYVDNESVVSHQQYLYNGDGQRVYEVLDGSLKGSFYDGNQVISEFDNNGKVNTQFIHGSGLGGDVGSLVFKEELNSEDEVETSYYFYNYRGDVIDVVCDTETVSYRYDAFGRIIEQSGDGIENNLLFSSKRFNEAIGLSYFDARYYDAFIGRFISRDPMGYIDGPNQYFYVANNPLGFIDPFGLWKRTAWNNVKKAASKTWNFTKNVFSLFSASSVYAEEYEYDKNSLPITIDEKSNLVWPSGINPDDSTKKNYETGFRGLQGTEWKILGPETIDWRYNCISFSIAENNTWTNPDKFGVSFYESNILKMSPTIEQADSFYENQGFSPTDTLSVNADIDYYSKFHAAVVLNQNWAISKTGQGILMLHPRKALEGDSYGTIIRSYKHNNPKTFYRKINTIIDNEKKKLINK